VLMNQISRINATIPAIIPITRPALMYIRGAFYTSIIPQHGMRGFINMIPKGGTCG